MKTWIWLLLVVGVGSVAWYFGKKKGESNTFKGGGKGYGGMHGIRSGYEKED